MEKGPNGGFGKNLRKLAVGVGLIGALGTIPQEAEAQRRIPAEREQVVALAKQRGLNDVFENGGNLVVRVQGSSRDMQLSSDNAAMDARNLLARYLTRDNPNGETAVTLEGSVIVTTEITERNGRFVTEIIMVMPIPKPPTQN